MNVYRGGQAPDLAEVSDLQYIPTPLTLSVL